MDRGIEFNVVYRSQAEINNSSPDWPEIKIDLSELCYGDINRPLKLSIFDYQRNGKHILLGGIETTVATLLDIFKEGDKSIDIQKKKKTTGKLILHCVEVIDDM